MRRQVYSKEIYKLIFKINLWGPYRKTQYKALIGWILKLKIQIWWIDVNRWVCLKVPVWLDHPPRGQRMTGKGTDVILQCGDQAVQQAPTGYQAESGLGCRGELCVCGFCCCWVTQSCPTVCDPMDWSMPGFPILYHLLEFAQTRVHWVGDAI